MPFPGAISPRLLVGFRKTGYVGITTGPGDSVRDISDFIGTGPGGDIDRTSGGGDRTAPRDEIFAMLKTDFFLPKSFIRFALKCYKFMDGIMVEKSVETDLL